MAIFIPMKLGNRFPPIKIHGRCNSLFSSLHAWVERFDESRFSNEEQRKERGIAQFRWFSYWLWGNCTNERRDFNDALYVIDAIKNENYPLGAKTWSW